MLHLFSWSPRHEDLRLHHISDLSVDNTGRRLGVTLDRRESDIADFLRHALLPRGDERLAVLYH